MLGRAIAYDDRAGVTFRNSQLEKERAIESRPAMHPLTQAESIIIESAICDAMLGRAKRECKSRS